MGQAHTERYLNGVVGPPTKCGAIVRRVYEQYESWMLRTRRGIVNVGPFAGHSFITHLQLNSNGIRKVRVFLAVVYASQLVDRPTGSATAHLAS
jgi:hypothetical protein